MIWLLNYTDYDQKNKKSSRPSLFVYFKVAIDNLEFCCMDPDMEDHYRDLLHQWKNDEDSIKDELKEIGTTVKNLTKKLDHLVASTGTLVEQSSDEDGEYIENVNEKFVFEAI